MPDDKQGLIEETKSIGALCVETKSTEPSKRFLDTNLTVRNEASEISVFQISHAADFSRRTGILPPSYPQWQQEIRDVGCRGGERPFARIIRVTPTGVANRLS